MNLHGVFYVSQSVAPGMSARGFGRMFNMVPFTAKTGGLSPVPAHANFGVTCNALASTFQDTDADHAGEP